MSVRVNYMTQLPKELARTEQVQRAAPRPTSEQRKGVLAAAAVTISRRGIAEAKAELANTALLQLAKLLYERDSDGAFVNFEQGTGRILVPLPWGRIGYQVWGLRASEGRALRWAMFNRTHSADPAPWLDYDADSRCWFVNGRYLSEGRAVYYLQTWPVTLGEWKAAAAATRSTWAKQHLGE